MVSDHCLVYLALRLGILVLLLVLLEPLQIEGPFYLGAQMLQLFTLEQLSPLLLTQVADADTILVVANQSDRNCSLAMVV